MDAAQLYEAIASESRARGLKMPSAVEVPPTMRTRYELQTQREEPNRLVPAKFDDALTVIAAFLDPVLSGTVTTGTWDPVAHVWNATAQGVATPDDSA